MRADRLERVPWPAVVTFSAVALALAWLVAIPVWIVPQERPGYDALFGAIAAAMMFTPLVAVLIVMFVMKVPASERLRFLGMWPLRPAKRVVWLTVLGLFAPIVLVGATLVLGSLFGWLELDLENFSGFAAELNAQLQPLGMDVSVIGLPSLEVLVLMQLAFIPVGAVFNCLFAFGEEVGWRGWLLPALRPLGAWPALLLSGALWGLWHAPLILLGYNFNRTDWFGVFLMVAGCIAWGVFFGWLRMRSASVWPAVIAHGALNASGGMFLLLGAAGDSPDFALAGPLGLASWIVLAVVALGLALMGQFKVEPELSSAKRETENLEHTNAQNE
ncbi:CPBP family intramembrane glutamic endopeptidase [Leucobacter sp. 1207-22]|uniref:CPBP family intramembrane glutamic endopeptidase n=1 Tax=Leucobacter sp. 1207-22 TaxID=2604456 RepID=UPI004063403E